MTLMLQMYKRIPFNVEVVQVTSENLREVAEWCGGKPTGVDETTIRISKNNYARVGDFVLRSEITFPVKDDKTQAEDSYRGYSPEAFARSFEKLNDDSQRGVEG